MPYDPHKFLHFQSRTTHIPLVQKAQSTGWDENFSDLTKSSNVDLSDTGHDH